VQSRGGQFLFYHLNNQALKLLDITAIRNCLSRSDKKMEEDSKEVFPLDNLREEGEGGVYSVSAAEQTRGNGNTRPTAEGKFVRRTNLLTDG